MKKPKEAPLDVVLAEGLRQQAGEELVGIKCFGCGWGQGGHTTEVPGDPCPLCGVVIVQVTMEGLNEVWWR